MTRRAALVVLTLLAATACTAPSTSDSVGVLRQTADNMVEIDSGEMDLRFEAQARDGSASGFELKGPFSLTTEGTYPEGELEHTRFDGDDEQTGTFISDGTRVFIERDGERSAVPPATLQASGLAALARKDGDDDEPRPLDIESWIEGEPEISAGGDVGGADTDKVTAELDVAASINGLIDLARTLGGGASGQLQPIAGPEIQRVRNATEDSTLEIWSGKEDRLLRKVVAEIVFAHPDEELGDKLGDLNGGTFRLEATISDIND